MVRKRKKLNKTKPVVEKTYYEEITLTNPVTGEKYKQRVKIKRYKSIQVSDSFGDDEDDCLIKRISTASNTDIDADI